MSKRHKRKGSLSGFDGMTDDQRLALHVARALVETVEAVATVAVATGVSIRCADKIVRAERAINGVLTCVGLPPRPVED